MVGPNPSNELIGGVVGVVWNDNYATMTRSCDKSKSLEELTLEHFAKVVSSYPEGAILTFETHSKWSVREWDVMVQSKERGYEGLDRAECAEPWSRIIHSLESGHRRVQISVGTGEGIPAFKEAARFYVQEMVNRLEGYLRRPVDAYMLPVRPWI
jgi:hypothetical protein